MAKETTYERLKRVLAEIADGADNPQERATEALRVHRPEPSDLYKAARAVRAKEIAAIKGERLKQAQAMYMQWMRDGRPPLARFAKQHKVGISYMKRLLQLADKQLPEDQRRLMWSYQTRDFRTVVEAKKAERVWFRLWEESDIRPNPPGKEIKTFYSAVDEAVEQTRVGSTSENAWVLSASLYLKKHYPELMKDAANDPRSRDDRSNRETDSDLRKH